MKIVVFRNNNEIKATLTDGHRPKLTNYYEKIEEVYDFAKWASEMHKTTVDIEFR